MPTIPLAGTFEYTQASSYNVLVAPIVPSERWSSVIGIITAIIGNVLISFALNTQRYAHVRLQRAGEEKQDENDHGSEARKKSYGTVQKEIADERSKVNAQAKDEVIPEADDLVPQEETDALIPRVQPPSTPSSGSDDGETPDEKLQNETSQKNYLKSPWWWLGLILMIVGEGGNFLAYGFAPASIVSPLGVVALISNCLIAPFMLKERFRWRDALGVIVAVGGTATVALSAEGSNPRLGPDEILALIKRWEPLTYMGITSFAIIVLAFLSNKYGHRTITIDIGLVALFGGYTVLSTKGIASLLTNGLYKVVTYPISYPFVAVLVFTAVMQIKYINRALQHFNSTQVIPTQFVMFTISVVLGSAILYRDFERTTSAKIGQFFGGVALTFLGVWFITGGRSDDSSSSDEPEVAAEEGRITLTDEEAPPSETSPPRPKTAPSTTTTTRPQPFHPLAQSTTDMQTYITTAATLSPSPNPATKTPPRPEAAPRTTSTPLFRNQNYTLLQPPRPYAPQTPPQSPSPRRPVVPSRRGLSDQLSPRAQRGDPMAGKRGKETDLGASTGTTVSAGGSVGAGTGSTNTKPLSTRHASLVERMLSLPTPGPLMSPLSGGLSAVVANDLRRGLGGGGEPDGYFLGANGYDSVSARSRSRRRTVDRVRRGSGLVSSQSQAVEEGDGDGGVVSDGDGKTRAGVDKGKRNI